VDLSFFFLLTFGFLDFLASGFNGKADVSESDGGEDWRTEGGVIGLRAELTLEGSKEGSIAICSSTHFL